MKSFKITLALVLALWSVQMRAANPDLKLRGFVKNEGQITDQNGKWNPDVLAAYFGHGYDLLITKTGFSHQISKHENGQVQFHRVDVRLSNSLESLPIVEWQMPLDDYDNFIKPGNEEPVVFEKIQTFQRVLVYEIAPGVDVEFVMVPDGVGNFYPKMNFVLDKFANLENLQLRYAGQDELVFGHDASSFEILTSLGKIKENIPQSFVLKNGVEHEVKVKYVDLSNGCVGFSSEQLENYINEKLIIDPIPSPTLNWSTYYGGSNAEQGVRTAYDGLGGVFLGGITQSAAGIATVGSHQGTYGGSPFFDAFITKFDINGVRLWSTYFGGSFDEQLYDLITDGAGNVFFTGSSASAGLGSVGTHQPSNAGNTDVILVKLNATGGLMWSTYFGGALNDSGRGLALSGTNIVICGQTASVAGIATAGAHQLAIGGGTSDGFMASFSPAGLLNWGTYFGGTGVDICYQIKVTPTNDLVMVGTTNSAGLSTVGAFQVTIGGSNDALIANFDASGNRVWSTYFGNTHSDNGYAISVDVSGDIFVAGQTNSASGIASVGAYDTALSGTTDGYILSLNNAGSRNWSTYVGGGTQDVIQSIWTDGVGNIYIGGNTSSTAGLATVGANQTVYGGGASDGLLAAFDLTGAVAWISYFGGSGDDYIRSVAGDAVIHLFVAGFSSSASTISTAGAHQTTLASSGVSDAFLSDYSVAALTPVELVSFDVNYVQDLSHVQCHWVINQGLQCHLYVLEKSLDGVNWSIIDLQDCSNAFEQIHFQFLDQNPHEGWCYYRITQQHDLDENAQMTRSLFVGQNEDVFIYPNPCQDHFVISSNEKLMSLCMFDMNGRLVKIFPLNDTMDHQMMSFDCSDLTPGVYLVDARDSGDQNRQYKIFVE